MHIVYCVISSTAVTIFQGQQSLSEGAKYTGMEKFAIFDPKSPFMSETVRDGTMVTMDL